MQAFYKKSLLILIALLLVDAMLAGVFLYRSQPSYTPAPALRDGVAWVAAASSDIWIGGTSTIRLDPSRPDRLVFDYRLTKAAKYPYAAAQFVAKDAKGRLATVDLSRYDSVTFLARCKPAGAMNFNISIFDDKLSTPGQFLTYRTPSTFFPCNEQGVPVSLDTRRMTIPDWWFEMMKLKQSSHEYKLDKVAQIAFGTSSQAPFDVDSHVQISELTLHGSDQRYIAALVVSVLASVVAFAVWFFRTHARTLAASLNSQMTTDLPLRAYRQLSVEPDPDPEKAAVLKFIATNYTDPQLDLDAVVSATGANRNKVNELLKKELGITFTAYLNKLRLTEAARLLAEHSAATIAEIAYSIGYANVSYFNKLFKDEYGCTPKAFQTLAGQQRAAAASLRAEPPPPETAESD